MKELGSCDLYPQVSFMFKLFVCNGPGNVSLFSFPSPVRFLLVEIAPTLVELVP